MNPFTAEWSEEGHLICLGQWKITFDQRLLELPNLTCYRLSNAKLEISSRPLEVS